MPDQRIVDSGFTQWSPDQLPDLSGKVYLITGANSGVGLEAARMLAAAGGDVVLACRSEAKAAAATHDLQANARGAVSAVRVDLADLRSVREAAATVRARHHRVDALINNAGVMQTPLQKTRDGFELQLGVNHIGHFEWTRLLLDRVEAAAGRVVVVSSIAHKYGALDFDDLMMTRRYSPTRSYTRSKLANLMFAFELDRRLQAAGARAMAVACHPGYADTRLQSTRPTGFFQALYRVTNPLLAQSARAGAAPTVLAAAAREAKRGAYYGPQHFREARGPVGDATVAAHARDRAAWGRLWVATEDLLGVRFDVADALGASVS